MWRMRWVMFLSYLWGARDWGGCEQGVCVALTFCMGACDAWHVTCDVVMTCDWPSPCPLSSPASVSDQMTTNCHQSQQNSGKISTRIIFVRRTGVIQTSHTWGETVWCQWSPASSDVTCCHHTADEHSAHRPMSELSDTSECQASICHRDPG